MQLLCNNVFLDLYTGQEVTFTRKNILLAFDDIEMERTAEFTLPATPTNMGVFDLAHLAAYPSTGISSALPTKLYMGTVVKDGVLMVSSFENNEFNAVFYTSNDLTTLSTIKSAGQLSDYLKRANFPHSITYNKSLSTSTDAPFIGGGYCIPTDESQNYPWTVSPRYPSINFAVLFQACCTHFGVTAADPVTSATFGYYIVPPSLINSHGKDAQSGDLVYAADNLPDVTFIDLIKTYGMIVGKLPYIEGNVLTFETGSDYDLWTLLDLTGKVTKYNRLVRYVNGYADDNYTTEASERIKGVYAVNNTTIEPEKIIYQSPFTGGRDVHTYIPPLQTNAPLLWIESDDFAIGYKSTNNPSALQQYLQCLDVTVWQDQSGYQSSFTNRFPNSNIFATICSEGVSVEVEVKMTAMEFEQLQPKTRVLLDGTFYMWQSVTWADGIATLQLVKVK